MLEGPAVVHFVGRVDVDKAAKRSVQHGGGSLGRARHPPLVGGRGTIGGAPLRLTLMPERSASCRRRKGRGSSSLAALISAWSQVAFRFRHKALHERLLGKA